MKITIDRDGCIECGVCASTCADVFELNPGEKASVVSKYQKGDPAHGEIGDDLSSCAQEAADGCPVQVIQAS